MVRTAQTYLLLSLVAGAPGSLLGASVLVGEVDAPSTASLAAGRCSCNRPRPEAVPRGRPGPAI
jgi:hypothetical protein